MYLKVYKCFKYRKELKFNYRYKTYSKCQSSILRDVNNRYAYNYHKHKEVFKKNNIYYIEAIGGYGGATELVSETNGVFCALICFYSERSLDK